MNAPDEIENFGTRLTSIMKERGISVREAARVAGLSSSTVSEWRSGTTPSDFEAVQKLANLLGVTLSFLLTGKDDSRPSGPPSIAELFERSGQVHSGIYYVQIEKLEMRQFVPPTSIPKKNQADNDEQ